MCILLLLFIFLQLFNYTGILFSFFLNSSTRIMSDLASTKIIEIIPYYNYGTEEFTSRVHIIYIEGDCNFNSNIP